MKRPSERRCPHSGIAGLGMIIAVLAVGGLVGLTRGAEAQTYRTYNTQPRSMPSGRGGVGAGALIGIGIGLGAALSSGRVAADDAPPPSRRHGGRVEADDDNQPIRHRTSRRERQGPKKPGLPDSAPPVQFPSAGETRFAPGEVLVETRNDRAIRAIARRLNLEVLESLPIRLTGSTLHRLHARDERTTAEILTRLRRDGAILAAQPNWLYTLQQSPAATPPASPSPAVETPAAAQEGDETLNAARPEQPPSSVEASGTGAPSTAALSPPATTTPTLLPGQWGAERLHLAVAHERAIGRGVRVAVIDTALDIEHPELGGAIEADFDALNGVPTMPEKHGTAMAGALAARSRLTGAAPAVRLLAARAFGPPGARGLATGSTFHVVKCLDWAAARHARVVSMSFAGPADVLLSRVIASARAEGIVAVAAAGNAGPQSPPLYPAADPGVIAVTASSHDDTILPVAVRGAHVSVTAPGADILVPAPNSGYDLTSGTSVAAAEVAGVVALMLEARGDLKPDDVRRILTETAVDLGAVGRDPVYGAGLVDAAAALGRLH